jgi:hypothetical protein
MTVRLFVRHAVADFEAWRKGYDANVDLRVRHGVKADGVHPSVDDPNDVTIFHDFETEEEARAMLGSPELKDAMDKVGVTSTPIAWLTHVA